jgi:hypothetical protein
MKAEEIYKQGKTVDITGAEVVEVLIRNDGSVVWVNIDGICILRVCRVKKLELNDLRPQHGQ